MAQQAPLEAASSVIEALAQRGETLSLAESCTGGLIASTITDVPGASRVFDRCLVVYADRAKVDELGVQASLLEAHGAVSSPVAEAMAKGARRVADAGWAVSATGIAGPSGGSPEKPVGTVHIAVAGPRSTTVDEHRFDGDRAHIKQATVQQAIGNLLDRIEQA